MKTSGLLAVGSPTWKVFAATPPGVDGAVVVLLLLLHAASRLPEASARPRMVSEPYRMVSISQTYERAGQGTSVGCISSRGDADAENHATPRGALAAVEVQPPPNLKRRRYLSGTHATPIPSE